jgi:hypothetical protein
MNRLSDITRTSEELAIESWQSWFGNPDRSGAKLEIFHMACGEVERERNYFFKPVVQVRTWTGREVVASREAECNLNAPSDAALSVGCTPSIRPSLRFA